MAVEKERLSKRCLAGLILSITVPLVTIVLVLVLSPIFYSFASSLQDLVNTLYIISRFVISGAALFFSVSGKKLSRKESIRGHRLAVAGTIISSLQLLLCILLLIGGLFNGLSLPFESPPQGPTLMT